MRALGFFFHHTETKVVAYKSLALQAEHLVLCEVTIVTATQWERMSMMLAAQKTDDASTIFVSKQMVKKIK